MKVILAGGCFDPLHYGHLLYLKAARRLGDRLVVAVTGNDFVNKGPSRPVWNELRRVAMLRELRCVDEAFITSSAEEAIHKVKPHIYVKGKEYENKLPEQRLVESYGGRVAYIDTPAFSSTDLITGRYLDLSRAGGR